MAGLEVRHDDLAVFPARVLNDVLTDLVSGHVTRDNEVLSDISSTGRLFHAWRSRVEDHHKNPRILCSLDRIDEGLTVNRGEPDGIRLGGNRVVLQFYRFGHVGQRRADEFGVPTGQGAKVLQAHDGRYKEGVQVVHNEDDLALLLLGLCHPRHPTDRGCESSHPDPRSHHLQDRSSIESVTFHFRSSLSFLISRLQGYTSSLWLRQTPGV